MVSERQASQLAWMNVMKVAFSLFCQLCALEYYDRSASFAHNNNAARKLKEDNEEAQKAARAALSSLTLISAMWKKFYWLF